MSDINFQDTKWKYIDKQFCDEVKELSNMTEFKNKPNNFPELKKLVAKKNDMEKDICSTKNCPTSSCKCYYSSQLTEDGYNNVLCGTKIGNTNIIAACPENCCRNGKGCPEPKRGGDDYPIETVEKVKTIEDIEKETTIKGDDWLTISIGIFLFLLFGIFIYKSYKTNGLKNSIVGSSENGGNSV